MLRNIFDQYQTIKPALIAFGIVCVTGSWVTCLAADSTETSNTPDVRDSTDVDTLTKPSPARQAKIESTLNGLPLLFVENHGQFPDTVAFTMQGSSKNFFFTPDGVTISLIKKVKIGGAITEDGLMKASLSSAPQRWAVKLDFVNANADIKPLGEDLQPAVISYFKGPQLTWKTGLRTYSSLRYPDLWPGIDLVYTGSVNQLKYQFEVQPGADPKQIQLAYRGVTGLALTEAGALTVATPAGNLNDDRPVAYQMKDGQKVEVSADYKLGNRKADNHPYGFSLGDYDPTHPLVIDPSMLVYAGYIGGNQADVGTDIAVDAEGNAYITGNTTSTEESFPENVGPDLSYSRWNMDAFVAKVSADGSQLIYAGYIGGNGKDYSWGIAVDDLGNAYVTGQTTGHFPVTVGPDLSYNGHNYDAFVAKVSADGTHLEYAGYIGGGSAERAFDIALDNLGRAYVTGDTWSHQDWNFPVTVGPDLTYNKGVDAFVARVAADGSKLEYAGYIGGSGLDRGNGIAVDNLGRAYITGYTTSTAIFSSDTSSNYVPFPVNVGPDTTHHGGKDAFVVRVSKDGTWFEYAGYIGGIKDDIANDIAVDDLGNAYIVGTTTSNETSFPITVGPDLTYNGHKSDAFVAKVSMDGAWLDYAGYIGGNNIDYGYGIAVNATGNAFVSGYTISNQATFPVVLGPDLSLNGSYDAFVARLAADGTKLDYAGYIGGRSAEVCYGIALDKAGNNYITGYTYSDETTFPVTIGPDLTHNGGKIDAFVAKIANPFDEVHIDYR
ncbi:MAG: SBBP repeat-containing protein [Chromatiales bacterium]